MGTSAAPPINEAVNLLSRLAPETLISLSNEFPLIAEELEPGRVGGSLDSDFNLDYERAEVAVQALLEVEKLAITEVAKIHYRMKSARAHRLIAQVAALICSSGVLGAFALNQNFLAAIISLLALLASIGTILAEFEEKLLRQGDGDIYQAFEQANKCAFRARTLVSELRLLIRHKGNIEELYPLIVAANKLSEELASWVIKMTGSR